MDTLLLAVQALHFAAAMLLAGGLLFQLYAGPTASAATAVPPLLLRGAALIALLAGLAWLGLEAAEMGNGWSDSLNPDTLRAVLNDTAFGKVWQWRMILAVAIVLVSWLPPAAGRDRGLSIMAAAFLASLALIGHAIMRDGGLGIAQIVNQMLHLLAAGIWLGGLPVLGLALLRTGDDGKSVKILRRFSAAGLIAVLVLLVTGLFNAILQLGSLVAFQTPYGRVLVIKLCLVVMMIILAALNRLIFLPRATSLDEVVGALRIIRRTVLVEVLLGVAVVVAATLLGSLQPPFIK